MCARRDLVYCTLLLLFLINGHAKLKFGMYGYQCTSRGLDWFLLIYCYLVNVTAIHRWGK